MTDTHTRDIQAKLYESIDIDPFPTNYNTSSLLELIGHVVSAEREETIEAQDLIERLITVECNELVVDLGCGRGQSRPLFVQRAKNCTWLGLEIGESYNLTNHPSIEIFNGIDMPLADRSTGYVYSKQVFEHVRYPEKLLQEIKRVLKPGGYFFGSVSGLEPYHYHSMFNFTPFGFYTALRENGLNPIELIPGADGISVALRHLSKDKKIFPGIFKGNSLFRKFLNSRCTDETIRQRNIRALMFSGHFAFIARSEP